MTERKFTPPTAFPTEYRTTDGLKAVVVARLEKSNAPLLTVVTEEEGVQLAIPIKSDGSVANGWDINLSLHDMPKRIERDEDGGNPTITVEQ